MTAMEVDEEETTLRKRKGDSSHETNNKKIKRFSGKEFRKNLQSTTSSIVSGAIQQFLELVTQNADHVCVQEYLEKGGNCIEILQSFERCPDISPLVVFDLVNTILLRINLNYPHLKNLGQDTCRYLLNSYVPLINKMLGLSSSAKERKTALKLLTAIVTFSTSLAKDILLNVNFNLTNIELLTKGTGDKSSVRDSFIHFLTAFLIDGHYATLSVLLEKKGLLTSVVSGLKFDVSDTVCIVLTAMRNHILENPSVSKTAKMKVFNTQVVKDIVNLYNWKGPAGIHAQKKKTTMKVEVDEYEKSKVNQVVHDFLLVLCTSHRHGIIFKDHTLGLGKDHQNKLLFTVLDSLERPWEHSYAKELVVKICHSCPDLTRTMWNNLKEFLIPRPSTKWLNAIRFSVSLMEELEPTCVDFCIRELSVMQICQALSHLLLPLPVLKTLIVEAKLSNQPQAVRYHVFKLLAAMLKMLTTHIESYKAWMSSDNMKFLKKYFKDYVIKHLPSTNDLLDNWSVKEPSQVEEADISCTTLDLLEATFELVDSYKMLSPQILDSLNIVEFNIDEFLSDIANYKVEGDNKYKSIQVKVISVFFSIDPSMFNVTKTLFRNCLLILLDYYYEHPDKSICDMLEEILKNTTIFEGSENEIRCWIDGVFHLKQFDSSVPDFLSNILYLANENLKIYLNKLSELYSGSDYNKDVAAVIKEISENNVTNSKNFIRYTYLSSVVLALIDYLNTNENVLGKAIKTYVQCVLFNIIHLQTSFDIRNLLSTCQSVPENIINYVKNWMDGTPATIGKNKCKLTVLQKFCENYLEGDLVTFFKEQDFHQYPNLSLDLLQMCVFSFSNQLNSGTLNNKHFANFEAFLTFLFENKLMTDQFLEVVLSNPIISKNFSIAHLNKNQTDAKAQSTKLIINLVTKLQSEGFTNALCIEFYRNKCVKVINSVIKKPQKHLDYSFSPEVFETFQLSPDDCYDILNSVSNSLENISENEIPNVYLNIIIYALGQFVNDSNNSASKPLPDKTIVSLINHVTFLIDNQKTDTSQLSKHLQGYLMKFPCAIKQIPQAYFTSLLNLEEYNEDNTNLIYYILVNQHKFVDIIEENVEMISKKKGLFLSVLSAFVFMNVSDEHFEMLYSSFEPSIIKSLNKPQKAGQHFEKHYKSLGVLLEKCMPEHSYKDYIDKVQKYETSETFHAYLLGAIFQKAVTHEATDKQIHNMLLTYIHLNVQVFKRKLKTEDASSRVISFGEIFKGFLEKLLLSSNNTDFSSVCNNETFKLFCKFSLKFGISEMPIYLNVLNMLVVLFKKYLSDDDAKLIVEMMISHSEFLDAVLENANEKKISVLRLFLTLCSNWPQLMERNHMPVLLASYNATLEEGDRVILQLLRMYEAADQQTNFYSFKPILWGRAASNHYSVRQDLQKAIFRQPKVGDVLDILQEDVVMHTIKNHPLVAKLRSVDYTTELPEPSNGDTYDLAFLLPLFSELLASENVVPTYKFAKSGALSLTVLALSNDDSDMRATACHVLHRYYTHLEAKTTGKDLGLWIRFIEVICKGTSAFEDYKLHNFASVYLANMALILTQPNHVMYVPLSHYLSAKADLDFSTIPELYTFLFGNDVNHESHRRFILEILHDGCRTEKEVTVFMKSMAYKLIMVMFSTSAVCDVECKQRILDVLASVTRHRLGCRILCENHSFLAFLTNNVDMLQESDNTRKSCKPLAQKFLEIVDNLRTNGMATNCVAEKHLCNICAKLECMT